MSRADGRHANARNGSEGTPRPTPRTESSRSEGARDQFSQTASRDAQMQGAMKEVPIGRVVNEVLFLPGIFLNSGDPTNPANELPVGRKIIRIEIEQGTKKARHRTQRKLEHCRLEIGRMDFVLRAKFLCKGHDTNGVIDGETRFPLLSTQGDST